MSFRFSKTRIPDVILVEPKVFSDARGFFAEVYKASDFRSGGIEMTFLQVNHSRSQKDVLRGLHYQLRPKAQAKLVSVVRGEIFDVAVDIRKGSPSYGQWVSETLSEANRKTLFIPDGFAHGFCVLSDEAEILYYCSEEYAPDLERNILWNDPVLGIPWPVVRPVLSPRDSGGKSLRDAQNNFRFGESQ